MQLKKKKREKRENEQKYEAYCEWQTTNTIASEVANKYEFVKKYNLYGIKREDLYGHKTRFLKEHPEYDE